MKKVWVVQYREFGEVGLEDQIYLCSTEEYARQRAYNILQPRNQSISKFHI